MSSEKKRLYHLINSQSSTESYIEGRATQTTTPTSMAANNLPHNPRNEPPYQSKMPPGQFNNGAGGYFYPNDPMSLIHYEFVELRKMLQMKMYEESYREMREQQKKANKAHGSKKSRTHSEMSISSSGNIGFIRRYDNGTFDQIDVPFNCKIRQMVAMWIKNPLIRQKETYFLLTLEMLTQNSWNEISIVLPLKILGKKLELLDELGNYGIYPDDRIKDEEICLALRRYIKNILNSSNGYIYFPVQAGWDLNMGAYNDGTLFSWFSSVPEDDFPITEKTFERIILTEERMAGYVAEMNQFDDPYVRYYICIYPIVAVLYSLLCKSDRTPHVYLNLLCPDRIEVDKVPELLQVMNRDRHDIIILGDDYKIKEVENVICRKRDETIIMDARYRSNKESSDSRKKIRNKELRIIGYVSGDGSMSNSERLNGMVVMLSYRYSDDPAINIELPDKTVLSSKTHKRFVENHCFEAFISSFVKYVETNYKDSLNLLSSQVTTTDPLWKPFEVTMRLIDDYLKQRGHGSLYELLNLPTDFDPSTKLHYSSEGIDWLQNIRYLVRKAMSNIPVCEKKGSENCIYFNDIYLDCPVKVMEKIFQDNYQSQYLQRTLRILKERGLLVSGKDGYTTKIQVQNQRKDYYRIKRGFFTVLGEVEIIDLAQIVLE